LDDEVVPANIMGLVSGNTTKGLRFSDSSSLEIPHASKYQSFMREKAQIEVDFNKRKEIIREQVTSVAKSSKAQVVIDESLLDEVCALVEYPRAFSGKFDEKYLKVPEEALISAMKSHQKYFHMVDSKGALLPSFISVANIESTNMNFIIQGNERVIRPRLADSEFFWNQDKAIRLDQRLEGLGSVYLCNPWGRWLTKQSELKS